MFTEPPPRIASPATYSALKDSKTVYVPLQGDYDVFGDGTVVIKPTPGHTPGHLALVVKLAKTGSVMLTGDMYHYPEEVGRDDLPPGEADKVQALATRKAVREFVQKTGTQLWIGHDLVGLLEAQKVSGVLRMSPAFRRFAAGALYCAGVAAGLAVVHAADARRSPATGPSTPPTTAPRSTPPADQINKDNVSSLRVAWRRPQVDPAILAANAGLRISNRFTASPIMVNGVLYAPDGLGLVEAMDPATGRTLWTQPPLTPGTDGLLGGGAHWGVAYWRQGADERIYTTRAQYLFALNAKTGQPIAGFGDGGKVDLNVGLGPLMKAFRWSGVPLIARDVVVIGSSMLEQDSARNMEGPPGDVRAYDIQTGKLRWTFHVIPHTGEPGAETWENKSNEYTGAGNVWSMMSADDDLGYVYLPTSGGTNDMYGGHRLGTNLYTSSIVCLEAKTGKRVWHFQTVHHDLFDDDNPAAPILVDIRVNGRPIKALVAGHQAGPRVRAGSRDRKARVADRRTSRARIDGSWREGVADPADSHEAAAVRAAGTAGRRPHRLHAATQGGGARDHQELRDGPAVHAAVDPRRRPRRQEGHASAAGIERRRRLDRRGLRSGNRDAVHPVEDEPVRGGSAQGQPGGDQPALPRRIACAGRGARAGCR